MLPNGMPVTLTSPENFTDAIVFAALAIAKNADDGQRAEQQAQTAERNYEREKRKLLAWLGRREGQIRNGPKPQTMRPAYAGYHMRRNRGGWRSPANSYAFGVENPAIDEYLQKPYPAYQLSGTELNGGFAEVVEVGGQMWQVTNAVYNASVGGFAQVNPGSSSSAFVLTPGAAPQYGIAPANASTPIAWSLSTIAPSPGIFVNVANYGAIGDGATDDTSAITRAIAACGIGSTLFFPHTAANVYIVNPNASTSTGYGEYWALTVPQSSLKIQGESNVVTIRLNPNGFIRTLPQRASAACSDLRRNAARTDRVRRYYSGRQLIEPNVRHDVLYI